MPSEKPPRRAAHHGGLSRASNRTERRLGSVGDTERVVGSPGDHHDRLPVTSLRPKADRDPHTVAPICDTRPLDIARCGCARWNPTTEIRAGRRHHVVVDGRELAQLIDEAVAARRILTPETGEAVWESLRRAAEVGATAVDVGLRMLHDPDRDVRAVGCELLAECCNGREAPTDRSSMGA